MRETARALALAMDREVGEVQAALGILALSHPLAAGDFAGFYWQCLDALRFLPHDAWITLSDLQGQLLLNTRVPYGTPLSRKSDLDAVRRVVATGRPSNSDLFVDALTQQPIVSIDAPVFRDGQVHAVLSLIRQAETLRRLFFEQRLPHRWMWSLSDGKQRIIATSPAFAHFVGEPVTPRMAERSAAAEEGWFPSIAQDGTPVYSAFSRVRSTGWTLALLAPAAVVDAPRRQSLWLVVGGGLALSALAMGLAVGLSRRIAVPIKRLVAATQSLSHGLPVAIDTSCAVQEVQEVGVAMHNTAVLLQQREVALQQAHAELERRVEERTAALRHEMAERQRLEQEAQRTAHFALLGRLAAGVSHEIRNPLASIFLDIDLLEEEYQHPSPDSQVALAESLAAIRTNLARIDELVQDYLSLVRVATIQREPQDLGAAVQAWVAEMQGPAVARGVTIQTAGLTTLGQVAFHAGTLRRAVLNLLQNALEAMSQGGTVTLEGQGMATHVQLQVRDTGSGIPVAHLAQIFEPLYTTKPEGTGLGLYIVQEIVTAHAGQITVESVEGQGTTFTLTLPRVVGEG
jgi:signal transduction histidine kinase